MVGRRYSMGMTLVVLFALFLASSRRRCRCWGSRFSRRHCRRQNEARANADLATARAVYDRQPSKPEAILGLEQALSGARPDRRRARAPDVRARSEPRRAAPRFSSAGADYLSYPQVRRRGARFVEGSGDLAGGACALGLAHYLSADYARAQETYCQVQRRRRVRIPRRRGGRGRRMRRARFPTGPLPTPATTIKLPGSVSSTAADAPKPIAASYLEAVERLLAGDEDGSAGDS